MDTSNVLVAGDFNFHMDDESNNDTRRVLDLLKAGDLSQYEAASSQLVRSLRSSEHNLLYTTHTASLGWQSVAAPSLCNALPQHLTLSSMTTAAFKVKLKTYLFSRTFGTALWSTNVGTVLYKCHDYDYVVTHGRYNPCPEMRSFKTSSLSRERSPKTGVTVMCLIQRSWDVIRAASTLYVLTLLRLKYGLHSHEIPDYLRQTNFHFDGVVTRHAVHMHVVCHWLV